MAVVAVVVAAEPGREEEGGLRSSREVAMREVGRVVDDVAATGSAAFPFSSSGLVFLMCHKEKDLVVEGFFSIVVSFTMLPHRPRNFT